MRRRAKQAADESLRGEIKMATTGRYKAQGKSLLCARLYQASGCGDKEPNALAFLAVHDNRHEIRVVRSTKIMHKSSLNIRHMIK